MVKHLVLKNLFKALVGRWTSSFVIAPCFSVERLVSSACCFVAGDNLGFTLPHFMLGAFETKMREFKNVFLGLDYS